MRKVLLATLSVFILLVMVISNGSAIGVQYLGYSSAIDINNSGQILIPKKDVSLILNSDKSVARTITNPSSDPNSYYSVQLMNDNGVVAGFVYTPNYGDGSMNKSIYIWKSDGGEYISSSGDNVNIFDFNNSGTIVGSSSSHDHYGAQFPPDGWVKGYHTGTYNTDEANSCYGINNNGSVVGITADYANTMYGYHYAGNDQAHIYYPDGTITDIGPGRAMAINDNGVIAGRLENNEICYWSTDHVRHDLGLPDGYTSAEVKDINSSGAFVSTCYNSDTGAYGAYYWSLSTGLINLPALNAGENTYAYAINDAGQIVGTSFKDSNNKYAVMWSVPEPGSIVILLFGLSTIGIIRRRK